MKKLMPFFSNGMKIPIEISARHIHLSKEHADQLFGADYGFEVLKNLSQPGQFAYKETVKIVSPKNEIEDVRLMGPHRAQTQVEISETEARKLGINPPIRRSGDLAGSVGIKMIGPAGEVNLKEGVIVALRHIHMDSKTAEELKIKDGDKVDVDIDGVRDLIFESVVVRVSDNFQLAMHLDTDEANAAGIDEKNHAGKLIIA